MIDVQLGWVSWLKATALTLVTPVQVVGLALVPYVVAPLALGPVLTSALGHLRVVSTGDTEPTY